MDNTYNVLLYRIGYIITICILLTIARRVRASGFKGYFHDLTCDLTEILGREKSLFYKMNSFCLVASGLLAPIILVAFPKFANRYPDLFESSKNVLLHVIALIIYIAALLGGSYHVIYALCMIWKSGKGKKEIK
jgi:hypothetical protein